MTANPKHNDMIGARDTRLYEDRNHPIFVMERALRRAVSEAVADSLDEWFAECEAALKTFEAWRDRRPKMNVRAGGDSSFFSEGKK